MISSQISRDSKLQNVRKTKATVELNSPCKTNTPALAVSVAKNTIGDNNIVAKYVLHILFVHITRKIRDVDVGRVRIRQSLQTSVERFLETVRFRTKTMGKKYPSKTSLVILSSKSTNTVLRFLHSSVASKAVTETKSVQPQSCQRV